MSWARKWAAVGALVWATQVKGRQQTSLFISLLWVVYSLALLGGFLWLACKDLRVHAARERAGVAAATTAKLPYPSKLLEQWMEWERGEATPGRVMANLKTAGLRDLLEELVAAQTEASSPTEEIDAEAAAAWQPTV